jgi:hypothetical protein
MPGTLLVDVDGLRLRLTNLDKVLYPETGTTKGDVIHYYASIAPALLPHLAERPMTRKRRPDGDGHAAAPVGSFFEKDLGNGVPPWVLHHSSLHSPNLSQTDSFHWEPSSRPQADPTSEQGLGHGHSRYEENPRSPGGFCLWAILGSNQ